MAVAAAPAPMTTEELLALPPDGVERWLIQGELIHAPTGAVRFGSWVPQQFPTCLGKKAGWKPAPRQKRQHHRACV
jgi:hypothetical protein